MKEKKIKLINEFERMHCNEKAKKIEKAYFYRKNKKFSSKFDPFWFSDGDIPVLISAPHAVDHYRHKEIKKAELYTGAIVCLLNELTGCHGIATTKLYGGDPNIDDDCIYKKRIADFCSRNNVKFLLDIHGAYYGRNFDVDLGTNEDKNLLGKVEIKDNLEKNFHDFGFSNVSFNYFAASGHNTVAYYAAHEIGIPAVQVEINKKYRAPVKNPRGFHSLLGALVESIRNLAIILGLF